MGAALLRLARDEDSPTAVEYAIMASGVVLLIVLVVYAFGLGVNARLNKVTKVLMEGPQ